MSEPINQERSYTKYNGFGRCIYCGVSGSIVKLTDEHIIPNSLDGGSELEDASCPTCAGITKKFEEYCARKIYGGYRYLHNSKSYHKKNWPTSFPATLVFKDHEEPIELPKEHHPFATGIPVVPSENSIRGALRAETESHHGQCRWRGSRIFSLDMSGVASNRASV
jgi:hypothetical protein